MKKYIRDILDDLRKKEKPAPAIKLDKPPEPPVPGDLANQVLSDDPLQRARQLDYQAQKDEERMSS